MEALVGGICEARKKTNIVKTAVRVWVLEE